MPRNNKKVTKSNRILLTIDCESIANRNILIFDERLRNKGYAFESICHIKTAELRILFAECEIFVGILIDGFYARAKMVTFRIPSIKMH